MRGLDADIDTPWHNCAATVRSEARSADSQLAATMVRPPEEQSMHLSGGLRALNLSLNSYKKACVFENVQ